MKTERPTGQRPDSSGQSAERVPGPKSLAGADLHDTATSTRVSMRSGRGPRVVVVVHSSGCTGCRTYVDQLAAASQAFSEWGGRLSVVAYESEEQASTLRTDERAHVQVLSDPDATLGAEAAAVLLADEWGEVHYAVHGVTDHALPDAAEITEWLRFISIHCPECEQPEGEWRKV